MKKMTKIGFVGSQGTGKTTKAFELCAALKKEGHDVFMLSEVARSCPFLINEGATTKAQLWIFGKMLTREQSSKGNILVGDRTFLDQLAYGIRCNKELFEAAKPFVKEYLKTYDIIFYMLPNDDYLIEDGTRSVNKEFRDEIDILIFSLLDELDVNYVITDDVIKYTLSYIELGRINNG